MQNLKRNCSRKPNKHSSRDSFNIKRKEPFDCVCCFFFDFFMFVYSIEKKLETFYLISKKNVIVENNMKKTCKIPFLL